MNLRDPWFGFVRIVRISKLLASYWSKNLAKGWKHTFWIIKMQIFPKTKGFCNKRGLFRKKSLFSIKTTFTFLEKTQIPNIGFQKKTDFWKKKIETPAWRYIVEWWLKIKTQFITQSWRFSHLVSIISRLRLGACTSSHWPLLLMVFHIQDPKLPSVGLILIGHLI